MNVQKAKHLYLELDKKKPSCDGVEYAVFEKYDGWYGYIDLNGTGNEWIMSRAGRAIPSLVNLSKHIRERSPKHIRGRLIFEITIPSIPDFSTLNGVLNRSKAPCQASGVLLKCHDFITDENKAFQLRYSELLELVSSINSDHAEVAPIQAYGYFDCIQTVAEHVWERGGEGAIGKALYSPYNAGKRDWTLLKVKEDVDADLLVTNVLEGAGKYKGTLGALICKDKEGKVHRISGMTDEQRYQWWTNPEAIIGSVVEIKAMKKLPDGQYREPRFKAVRFDKTEADID